MLTRHFTQPMVPPNSALLVPRNRPRILHPYLPSLTHILPPNRLRAHKNRYLDPQRMARHNHRLRRPPLRRQRETRPPPPLRHTTRRFPDPSAKTEYQRSRVQNARTVALVRLSAAAGDE
jgi:hypothetical protein